MHHVGYLPRVIEVIYWSISEIQQSQMREERTCTEWYQPTVGVSILRQSWTAEPLIDSAVG